MQKLLVIIFLLGTLTFSVNAQCCSGAKEATSQAQKSECAKAESSTVKAYYFHATRRCETCQAVEKVTKETVETYGTKVSFQSINRETDADNELLKKYKVSGQTLIIVSGDKVVNLTNDAFMNARTKPAKLEAKIKKTIDGML